MSGNISILGIDPGSEQTAYVLIQPFFDSLERIDGKGIVRNDDFIGLIKGLGRVQLAIEGLQSFGKVSGYDILETAYFIGRIQQVAEDRRLPWRLYLRTRIKGYVAGDSGAKDPDVRKALIAMVGSEKKGGPLFGVVKDMWSALAVAVYHNDVLKNEERRKED